MKYGFINIILTFVSVHLYSCALPDIKPFADATASLHGAIVKTDSNVRNALIEAGADQDADAISKELRTRINVMQAVVEYTDALANIADAGKKGSENAGKVADSLGNFLNIISAAPLPVNYISMAQSLYGIAANARAAKSFSEAVRTADPAIQSIASILVNDFSALESLLAATPQKIISDVQTAADNAEIINHRKVLEKRRRALEAHIDNSPGDTVKVKELLEVNNLIEATRDRYEPLMSNLKSIEDKLDTYLKLVTAAKEGIDQWAKIHGNLATAVENGLPPNTRLLSATVVEIRSILDEENNDE